MPNFDETLRPQDDFFGYVNNNWLKNNPIPLSESLWGTFYVLRDKSADAIRKIVEELSNTPNNDLTYDQKLIKVFFSAALSYSDHRINHLQTIADELQKIRNIKSKNQLAYYLGSAHRYNFAPFWLNYISNDDKNNQIQVLRIHQGGLSLPNRDYYLDNSPRMKRIRKAYETYFKTVHNLLPNHSPNIWKIIFDIELNLANASWTDIELRDVEKGYNRFTIKQLQSRYPKFDWLAYFKSQGWEKPNDNIVIDQPSFIDEVMNVIENYPLGEIQEYLSWHIVNELFSWVDEATAAADFEFYGKIITGKKEINSPLKRIVLQIENLIVGETLGREYAARYFPESSKKAVLEIVEDIKFAYHKRIDKVVWMKDNTKKTAHQKLDNTRVFIGYPSVWRNLDKLQFDDANHLANILSARKFMSDINIAEIGKKPDPNKWFMNAQTVNACYDPNQLVICFPAAILQPPFYDPNVSYATNLGGIGAVIGHELTHGFDDQGSEFDEYGNMSRWQTKAEQKSFKAMAKGIVKQANAFEVLPGLFLKGKLILGEAIADIGGLELAIEALHEKMSAKDIDNPLRELFTNAAVVECGAQREEQLVQQCKIDPHPPSKFRINCTVTHIDDFYKVYDVTPKDELYLPPEDRVHIW